MKKLLDISYSTIDADIRKIDVFLPENDLNNNPCIFFIHGGGWSGGSRQQWHPVMEHFCNLGYVCTSCSYHLLPDYRSPTQLEDVRLAMSFIKERADEYGFDENKVAVWGSSAGGYLCAMLATIGDDDNLGITPEVTIRNTRPAAAVYLCSVLSLHKDGFYSPGFLGKEEEEDPELYSRFSPVDRITSATPPAIMIVGDKDITTPIAMHECMKKECEKNKIFAQLEVLLEIEHGYGYGVVTDAQKKNLELAEQFLGEYL